MQLAVGGNRVSDSAVPRSEAGIEQAVGIKVLWRLVLPCALFILVGAIDRTNVGFAALQMNADLGLSSTQYGFAAGVLFIGYVLAKYPSVLAYEALGMRRWLALITFAWGLGASAMAAVTSEWQIYALRLFIGFMEGGLSSGLMIYLSQWAPERWRATILAVPIMSINISQVIGAPLSGWLLDLDNPLGIAGWRFMFLMEGLPALVLAGFALAYFPDAPREARWLTPDERAWVTANVKGAEKPPADGDRSERWAALRSHSKATISVLTNSAPAPAKRSKAASRLRSVRELQASVTTQTSKSSCSKSSAVCSRHTCASQPASTMAPRPSGASAGFCR